MEGLMQWLAGPIAKALIRKLVPLALVSVLTALATLGLVEPEVVDCVQQVAQ